MKLLSDDEFVVKFGIVPVEDLVLSARVKFFSKLAGHASEAMRTLITAVVDMPGTFAHEVRANLDELRCFSKLDQVPLLSLDPHHCCDLFFTACSELRDIVGAWVATRKSVVHREVPVVGGGGACGRADPFWP